MQRRSVLKGGAAAVGAALVGGPFQGLVATPASADRSNAPFRSLRPVPDLRDGVVRLHLPEGFSYRSFHDTEQPVILDDGTELPGRHDGMGAFRGSNGNVILVRNHELNGSDPGAAFGPGTPYDSHAYGGCTTIEVTPFGEVLHAHTSLNGTMMNCSGGVMPWGSWVTCEETVNGPGISPDFTGEDNTDLQRPHGFVFEVPAGRDKDSDRQPVTQAGRFCHEAVSFDPVEGVLYLTEDNFGYASGFYRYRPRRNPMQTGYLDNEGTLQMLKVVGEDNAHLEARQRRRATYHVEWVDIEEPTFEASREAPMDQQQALQHVGSQGWDQGAAFFSRLEGQVYDGGVVYFCSTQGGGPAESGTEDSSGYGNGNGQVWAYDTRSQRLQVLYQAPVDDTEAEQILQLPDNVTTSARGTLVLCEDGDPNNYLRGLSRGGQIWDIALNQIEGRLGDEFAGSTFSTDGHTLFANIQASAGMTLAIWGPWHRIGV